MRMKKVSRGFHINPNWDGFKTIDPNEAVILSFLPTKWRWLARNKDGDLVIFSRKPIRKNNKDFWFIPNPRYGESLDFPYRRMFGVIKWSDDEPTNIDKLLKENINYATNKMKGD